MKLVTAMKNREGEKVKVAVLTFTFFSNDILLKRSYCRPCCAAT